MSLSPTKIPSRCWAEIDLNALRQNAATAREQSGCEIMAVVKANAYGHGAVGVAWALEDSVSIFGVANLYEGEELRHAGIIKPILLLSACLPDEEEIAVSKGYHVSVNSLAEAATLDAAAARLGTKARAHLVADTGMGRMGFTQPEWTPELIRSLLTFKNLTWEGIGSHLPSADEDEEFTHRQIELFRRCVAIALEAGLQPHWIHLSNSAGLLGYYETQGLCTLARAGLMLYGVSPLPDKQPLLHPVLTWKTKITLIRELPIGHGVSYGSTFVTTRPTLVATLACGYGDGYPRQVSGEGASVLIHGQRCPILGRVTMDQIMVDVTDLNPPALPGDEAVILGTQGCTHISADEIASKAGTIPWHVFTGITARVERVAK